jgi:hypothetical protein
MAVQVVHLCPCINLNQRRYRNDVLDFKQAIDIGNTVSLNRPGDKTHRASQAKLSNII